jgi:RNA polymerase sigma factor (TIGR02999 family)
MSQVTRILSQIEQGDSHAAEQLLPLVYEELRRLASSLMAQEHPGQTLQATALVHEAYLRLVGEDPATSLFANRRHFFCAAAEAMRRILVDNARHKQSLKAGKGWNRIDLDGLEQTLGSNSDDLLTLEEALQKLASENPVAAELAQLRLFAGLTVDEAAESMGLARRTAFRYWTYARSFRQLEMTGDEPSRTA